MKREGHKQRIEALAKTPVTILTGFLGSGKTTLLNRALRDPVMANAAVIINEFGEMSLDHVIAARSNDTIMVLENGCLCCTVFGDLVTTLNNLYHAREDGEIPCFNHVMIETSGLANPSQLGQAFLSDPILAGLYRVGGTIGAFDAVNGPETLNRHVESVHQISLADHIVITKFDLIEPANVNETEIALTALLRALNPSAKFWRTDDPAFEIGHLLSTNLDPTTPSSDVHAWLNAAAYEEREKQQEQHAHNAHHHQEFHDRGIASFCFVREQPIHREALRLLLEALQQNLGPNLLRVKGIIHVAEDPARPAIIQGAQHLLHNLTWLDQWPDADRRTKIVFITQGFDRAEIEDMIAVLDRVATRTVAARRRARSNV